MHSIWVGIDPRPPMARILAKGTRPRVVCGRRVGAGWPRESPAGGWRCRGLGPARVVLDRTRWEGGGRTSRAPLMAGR